MQYQQEGINTALIANFERNAVTGGSRKTFLAGSDLQPSSSTATAFIRTISGNEPQIDLRVPVK